jgi:hypothetical protein
MVFYNRWPLVVIWPIGDKSINALSVSQRQLLTAAWLDNTLYVTDDSGGILSTLNVSGQLSDAFWSGDRIVYSTHDERKVRE